MAFAKRDSSSVGTTEQLGPRCANAALDVVTTDLRAAQTHRACCCNCDDDATVRQHVADNMKNNPERENSSGRDRAMLLSIFRGPRGRNVGLKGFGGERGRGGERIRGKSDFDACYTRGFDPIELGAPPRVDCAQDLRCNMCRCRDLKIALKVPLLPFSALLIRSITP